MDFCQTDDEGNKNFKYAEQLSRVAHREQVNIFQVISTYPSASSKNYMFSVDDVFLLLHNILINTVYNILYYNAKKCIGFLYRKIGDHKVR